MPKVLMPIGDATEVLDTMYAYFRLPEDGFEVVVAGPAVRTLSHGAARDSAGGRARVGHHARIARLSPGRRQWRFATSIRRNTPACSSRADRRRNICATTPTCCGSRSHFFAAGKPVAALCHGIEILTAADCIRGRTVTTVAKCALDAAQGGAKYVNQACVVDGNLVTARTWHDNTPLLAEFVQMLKGKR